VPRPDQQEELGETAEERVGHRPHPKLRDGRLVHLHGAPVARLLGWIEPTLEAPAAVVVGSPQRLAQPIDRHLDEYRDIVRGTDRSIQVLSSSSLVQFFVSAFVLAVAVGGAAINFSLIARPMAEMVGGTSFIGSFRTADIAALVIILVEISMGLFLMESLRITRLFPVIGALADKLRVARLEPERDAG